MGDAPPPQCCEWRWKSQSPYKREVRRWGLECGDHWGGDDVFLDPAHASDRFRRDPQRVPFFTRLVLGNPEMNNTVADNNVLWPDLRPLLTAEFGKEPGADRAIVSLSFGGCRALCRSDLVSVRLQGNELVQERAVAARTTAP
jgi:hypothetical protein